MSTPTLLAFDTSTENMHLALSAAGEIRVREMPGGALASAQLIPQIKSLLSEAGLNLRDLDAIAFGEGPGAFTGLRTACSVAQGLAWGLSKPVLALNSLLAVAQDALTPEVEGRIWVAVDARMNEIYAAHWERRLSGWQILSEPRLYTLEALHQAWSQEPPHRVAGNAVGVFEGRLPLGQAELFPQAAPRGAALMKLAQGLWQQGAAMPAERARPLYLRDNVAQTLRQREAARGASTSSCALVSPLAL